MKILIFSAITFSFLTANADPNCKELSSYVGKYKMISKTCDNKIAGDELSVELQDKSYMLTTDGLFIGVNTGSGMIDTCTLSSDGVTVQTCANSTTCLPQHWYYQFSGKHLTFSAKGCQANYNKLD